MHLDSVSDANEYIGVSIELAWYQSLESHTHTYSKSISFKFHSSIKCCGMYSMDVGNYTSKYSWIVVMLTNLNVLHDFCVLNGAKFIPILSFFSLILCWKLEKYHIDGSAVGVVDIFINPMDFSRNLFLRSQSIR